MNENNITKREVTLLEEVSLSYDEINVLTKFSLKVPYQKITCIVGPSGCGKTSILNLLSGLILKDKGQVNTNHERIGYVFQEDRLLPWETVYNNIRLVREEENQQEIMSILKDLELDGFEDKLPEQLSGGMRQRCALARGFYFGGSLLLMDEPFKSLDYDLRLNLVSYLRTLWERNKNTVVFVTHDIDEALLLGHQVMVLSKRPAKIIGIYDVHEPFELRHVMGEEHINIRSQIIEHMRN